MKKIFITTIIIITSLFSESDEILILKKEIELKKQELSLLKIETEEKPLTFSDFPNADKNFKIGIGVSPLGLGSTFIFEYNIDNHFSISVIAETYNEENSDYANNVGVSGNGYGFYSKYYLDGFSTDSPYLSYVFIKSYLNLNHQQNSFYENSELHYAFYRNEIIESETESDLHAIILGYQWIWNRLFIQFGIGFAKISIDKEYEYFKKENLLDSTVIGDFQFGWAF